MARRQQRPAGLGQLARSGAAGAAAAAGAGGVGVSATGALLDSGARIPGGGGARGARPGRASGGAAAAAAAAGRGARQAAGHGHGHGHGLIAAGRGCREATWTIRRGLPPRAPPAHPTGAAHCVGRRAPGAAGRRRPGPRPGGAGGLQAAAQQARVARRDRVARRPRVQVSPSSPSPGHPGGRRARSMGGGHGRPRHPGLPRPGSRAIGPRDGLRLPPPEQPPPPPHPTPPTHPGRRSLTREEALSRTEVAGHLVLVPTTTGANLPLRQSSSQVRWPGTWRRWSARPCQAGGPAAGWGGAPPANRRRPPSCRCCRAVRGHDV